ncbi:phage tail sheath family protein [Streptomyces sp. NPDC021080]|uniref:phage tail sheath family protein n=1 Tax=Streptomyces sp. NPDC021080 TaxID=3365110 RepID=UPI00379AE8B4
MKSWSEFEGLYGLGNQGRELAGPNLVEAVFGFFANGGTSCHVVGTSGSDIDAYTAALAGLEKVPEVDIVAAPDLWKNESDAPAIARAIAGHCAQAGNRMALLHAKQGASPEDAAKTPGLFGLDETETQFTTVYYPWLNVPGVGGTARTVPPSGHMAGIWARTDAERGVFKAPANQDVRGALSIEKELTDAEQGPLNEAGVNCLRAFPGRGLLVWGARTLSINSDFKYLNVRRLVNFLTESIRTSTTWTSSEVNDDRLWAALRHSVTSFLTDQWKQGALQGRASDEAFYVICDQSNNTAESVKAGKVVVDFGVAPVRPAEFVHLGVTLAGRV